MKGLTNKLTTLLGFRHPHELAEALEMPIDTLNGFNSGRGSKYVIQAYGMLVRALEKLSEDDRATILNGEPPKELTLSEKYLKQAEIRKAIEEKKPQIQKHLDAASETFFTYNALLERYKEITAELNK